MKKKYKSNKVRVCILTLTLSIMIMPMYTFAQDIFRVSTMPGFQSNQIYNRSFDHALQFGVVEANEVVTIKAEDSVVLEKGKMLLVEGTLVVEGTLEINGSLAISAPDFGENGRDGNPAQINNKGTMINNGSIRMHNATLTNRPNAVLTNNGIISISSLRRDQIAIANMNGTTVNGNTVYGTIANNGTINIRTMAGYGIYNDTNAIFQNDGIIAKVRHATIKGLIEGNAITLLEE